MTQSAPITCAQIATILKNSASEASVANSSTMVRHMSMSQEDRESVGTRVLRKIDGRWHIVATQNTDVRHGRRH